MNESAGARRTRRWTRVEAPAPVPIGDRVAPPGGHRLAVYPARVVRCSCGAAILATEPEALRGPVTDLADEVLTLHAAWCEELEVDDFATSEAVAPAAIAANGHGHRLRPV
jgi:hypothetical protein